MSAIAGDTLDQVASNAERARRRLTECVLELQAAAASAAVVINDVTLPDGIVVTVSHGLRREPRMSWLSAPRGPVTTGRIEEIRTGSRAKHLLFKATGFGATVTVDLAVL